MFLFGPDRPFGGVNAAEYNALNEAIVRCGQRVGSEVAPGRVATHSHNDWLRQTQKLDLVIQLVDKLHELGYRIKKVGPDKPLS